MACCNDVSTTEFLDGNDITSVALNSRSNKRVTSGVITVGYLERLLKERDGFGEVSIRKDEVELNVVADNHSRSLSFRLVRQCWRNWLLKGLDGLRPFDWVIVQPCERPLPPKTLNAGVW